MHIYAQMKIVLLTTIVWVIVTYATQPESEKVLQNFYRKIQPGGPVGQPLYFTHPS